MTTTTSTTSGTSSTTPITSSSSNSQLGTSILSSLGTGAGIDTNTIVSALTAARKSTLEDPITTKQAANTAQISALGSLASDVSTFSTALQSLIAGGTLQTQPTSSDTSVLAVSAISGQKVGALTSTVNVTQLAQSQTLESPPVAAGAGYASGTMTLTTTAGATVSLTAGSDFTDLASLVTAINGKTATTGVTASTVTDSYGTHLVMKGGSGTAQGFSVAATGDVSGFAYTPTSGDTATADVSGTGGTTGMQRLQAAQDAALTVDGVSYTRPSNAISDVIGGVSMNLVKTGTVTLGSTRPTTAISQAVNDFVSAYNTLKGDIDTATAASTSSAPAGALRGNSTIRDMQRQLSQMTTMPLTASGSINTLAQIGVSTNQDGTLSVNNTALSNALTNYPDDVEAMFNTNQSSSSQYVGITSAAGSVPSGVYSLTGLVPQNGATSASGMVNGVAMTGNFAVLTAPAGSEAAGLQVALTSAAPGSATITISQGLGGALQAISNTLTGTSGTITTLEASLNSQNSTLADALTKAESQLTNYTTLITSQFSKMNTAVSAIKATQSYLTQQVDLWTKSTSG